MKLAVLQENLAKAVSLASRFTSTRAQLPILGNILLKGTKSRLIALSTNLESSVSISLGAKVEDTGEIAVPSRVFSELIINLPKETVKLESEKEQLKVSTSGFSSTVLGINASDFPDIPSTLNKEKAIDISKEEFLNALSKVIFAASSDETRPILTGVLFIFTPEFLSLVSTDGFRLSSVKIKNQKSKLKHSFVVPKSILSEIGRMDEEELSLEFRGKEKQILFGFGDVIFSSRLLEGEYPDYEKIIPKTSIYKIRLDKEEFFRSVKLASIFARDNANIVKIKLLPDSVKVYAESSSAGNQETKVEAKVEGNMSGEFEIAFNYKFLEDFINSVGGEEIVMEFSDTDKPGVFLDPSSPDYLHLIMPVKIQG